MRNRERGIGNLAFISVLVLFVIAAAMAFVWKDEGDTAKAAEATAKKAASDADRVATEWQAAYNAMKETLGMSDAAIDGGSDNIPRPAAIQAYIRGQIYAKAAECETKAVVNLATPNYQIDESKLKIISQEGDIVKVGLAGNPMARETATVRQFLDMWPAPLEIAKLVAETNNAKNTEMFNRLKQRGSAFDQAVTTAAGEYETDKNSKQAVIDQQKQDLSSLRESVESQTAKIDEAATQVEQTKQSAEKQKRLDALEISALRNRLRNEQIRKELALAEDPRDGGVIAVSNTRGTVWIDLGRRQRVSRGTRFKVWRATKGNRRQDIAVIEVFRVDDTSAECQVVKTLSSVRITKGNNISNPFFDASRPLKAFIFGNLRTYPNEVARRRLAANNIAVARYLDDQVNIIVLGEPPVTVEEVEDEEEAASIRRKQELERSKRLDEILEKARSINALVVTEATLATFIEF
ncbi:MAG: hypothetical protein ACYTHK_16825 [Planctomycetota bacterium]|jgi:hypothetical protein